MDNLDKTISESDWNGWKVLRMSGMRPPSQRMPRPSDLLHMQRGRPPSMGMSTRYLGGEQIEGSHHVDDRAKGSPETRRTERRREAKTIRNSLMGCLIGDISRGSLTLEEVQQGLWQRLPAGDMGA